jgi:hypothetical protein
MPRRSLPIRMIAIRRGSCRLAICIGPWAIKIARNATGRRCNRGEADRWERTQTNPARRAMLCPVQMRLSYGIALIMQRAQPLSEAEADHLLETGGFPDWDYMPPDDEGHPFEHRHPIGAGCRMAAWLHSITPLPSLATLTRKNRSGAAPRRAE